MNGSHRTGDNRLPGGGYRSAEGDYRASGSYRRRSGEYEAGTGEYQDRSGGHRTGTDGHRSSTGGYRSGTDGYRSNSGGYRSSTGGYRTASGSHRVEYRRSRNRHPAVVLAGVVTGVVACLVAAFVVVGTTGDGDGGDSIAASGAEATERVDGSERDAVPNGCELLSKDLAGRLAPDAEVNPADSYESSERQNQCVWGVYGGKRRRLLTLELRAIVGTDGTTGVANARRTLQRERQADESGKSLLPGQRMVDKNRLEDIGDEGYVIYAVDKKQKTGEAVINLRAGNVLITVHYSGENRGKPLDRAAAVDGATDAAQEAVSELTTAQ